MVAGVEIVGRSSVAVSAGVLFAGVHLALWAIATSFASMGAAHAQTAVSSQGVATSQGAVEADRRAELDRLRGAILGRDRARRIAALESALRGDDVAAREWAREAALESRDPILSHLVLRDWLGRQRTIPVQLFATKEDSGSVTVMRNLGPLSVALESFDPANGAVTATMGATGYGVANPSTAVGTLAQTTLTLNTFGCQLALALTEHRTLDGVFRCQTLPVLVARVVLG